jgi:hypothetical protein
VVDARSRSVAATRRAWVVAAVTVIALGVSLAVSAQASLVTAERVAAMKPL